MVLFEDICGDYAGARTSPESDIQALCCHVEERSLCVVLPFDTYKFTIGFLKMAAAESTAIPLENTSSGPKILNHISLPA